MYSNSTVLVVMKKGSALRMLWVVEVTGGDEFLCKHLHTASQLR